MTNARLYLDTDSPTRRYLMQYTVMHQRREALVRELVRLREATTRATSRIDAMRLGGTPNHGGPEDAMLRVVDAEQRLETLIADLADALTARVRLIESLPDERHKTLLTLRYINGMGWEQVGYAMHYERTAIYDLHAQAIRAAQQAMDS
jgi:hypothetical protein